MKDCRLAIHSIYRASEGEGLLIGHPQVFVRFQGCSIGCVNCDSRETWSFEKTSSLGMDDVLGEIYREGFQGKIKRVSITGGDPLHPKNTPSVFALAGELKLRGYFVNIEAAGTRIIPEIFDLLDFISFDFKTPSSQVRTKGELLRVLAEQYPGRYQIKSVIQDRRDFDYVLKERQENFESEDIPWILTPSYVPGESMPLERFREILQWNEQVGNLFRVIGQQHKWFYGPDRKRV